MKEDRTFILNFQKGQDKGWISIKEQKIEIQWQHGKFETNTYKNSVIAALVFENNVKAFQEKGYTLNISCSPNLPGCLNIFNEEDDRTSITYYGKYLSSARIYDGDAVAASDYSYELQKEPPLAYFSSKKNKGTLFALHCLRRFIVHPASAHCPKLSLILFLNIDEALDLLVHSARADRLTHLEIYDFWNNGHSSVHSRPLGKQFSRLKVLYLSYWALDYFFSDLFPSLEYLKLDNAPQIDNPQPQCNPLEKNLDTLMSRAPLLHYLALTSYNFDSFELKKLAHHPLLRQLKTLDLFSTHREFDYETFLQLKSYFVHLERINLPYRAVRKNITKLFADWPQVVFASYTSSEPEVDAIDSRHFKIS